MKSAVIAAGLIAVASALPSKQFYPRQANSSTAGQGAKWDKLRGNIKHVIYLMMENHSFDNIAGYWDFNKDIDNLRNINYCNNYTNPNWTVWNEPISICAGPYENEVPLKDPDHNFAGGKFTRSQVCYSILIHL